MNILAVNLGSYLDLEDELREYPEILEGREEALEGYPYSETDDLLVYRLAPGVVFVTADGDMDRYLLLQPK